MVVWCGRRLLLAGRRRLLGRGRRGGLRLRRLRRRCLGTTVLGRIDQPADHVVQRIAVQPEGITTAGKQRHAHKCQHHGGIVAARLLLDHVGRRCRSRAEAGRFIRRLAGGGRRAVVTDQLVQIIPGRTLPVVLRLRLIAEGIVIGTRQDGGVFGGNGDIRILKIGREIFHDGLFRSGLLALPLLGKLVAGAESRSLAEPLIRIVPPFGIQRHFRFLIMMRGIIGNEGMLIRLGAPVGIIVCRAQVLVPRLIQLAPVIFIHRLRPVGRNGRILCERCGFEFTIMLVGRTIGGLFLRTGEIGLMHLVGSDGRYRRHGRGRLIKLFRLGFAMLFYARLFVWLSVNLLIPLGYGRFTAGFFFGGLLFVDRLALVGLDGGGLFINLLLLFVRNRLGGMRRAVVFFDFVLMVRRGRVFRDGGERVILLQRRKRLGIFAVHFGNGGVQLGDLPAQQFFRRTWLHILELAHNRTARLVVNLRPVFGSIVRQAIHGLANDCYKIRHKHFLVVTGDVPARYGL